MLLCADPSTVLSQICETLVVVSVYFKRREATLSMMSVVGLQGLDRLSIVPWLISEPSYGANGAPDHK